MQREDHAVTVAEVKEIMDEAIKHSQKANVKHLGKTCIWKIYRFVRSHYSEGRRF